MNSDTDTSALIMDDDDAPWPEPILSRHVLPTMAAGVLVGTLLGALGGLAKAAKAISALHDPSGDRPTDAK